VTIGAASCQFGHLTLTRTRPQQAVGVAGATAASQLVLRLQRLRESREHESRPDRVGVTCCGDASCAEPLRPGHVLRQPRRLLPPDCDGLAHGTVSRRRPADDSVAA
jgi:hypothetical protein